MFAKLAWTSGLLAVGVTFVSVTSLSAQAPQIAQPKDQQKIFFRPDERPLTGVGWSITTTSGEAEIALARHLVNTGAKEYAAWWCPHSHEQKLLFGKEAYQIISNSIKIECDSKGLNAKPDLCKAAKVPGFPTWVISGKQYSGVQNLNQLSLASGYKGNSNFKYIHVPRFF